MKDSVTKGFDDASCELYKQVMIKKAWLAEKDLPGNVSLDQCIIISFQLMSELNQ